MDLAAVMDEIGAALKTTGLNAYPYWADRITVPAAIVEMPDMIDYRGAYANGMNRITLPVKVLVGRTPAKAARNALAPYLRGAGTKSVRQAVDDHEPVAFDAATVTQLTESGVYTVAGTEYLGATFSVDIVGSGST